MKEKLELNPRPTDIVGHCKIEYKDPITDKVLKKIEGDNHVFIDQFYVQDLKSMLSCKLVLTNGTSELDTSMPMIPGLPVGYGQINSAAEGIFQGAYRTTDSYIYKIDGEKIESNYVYDFLSNQIPDTIRYVGLHNIEAQPTFLIDGNPTSYYNGSSITNVDENTHYTLRIQVNDNNVYDNQNRFYFSDITNIKIRIGTSIPNGDSDEYDIFNLISSDIDASTSFIYEEQTYTVIEHSCTFSMAYDKENENFIVRCSSAKRGRSSINSSNYKILNKIYYWHLNKALNSVVSTSNFSHWSDANSSNLYYNYYYLDRLSLYDWGYSRSLRSGAIWSSYLGFIDNNNNFCIFCYLNSQGQKTNNLFLVKENMETGVILEEQLPHSLDDNSIYWPEGSSSLVLYKNYAWIELPYDISHNNFSILNKDRIIITPVINTNNNSIYSYNISRTKNWNDAGYARIMKGFGTQFPNTWMVSRYNGGSLLYKNIMPFALTAYRLPLDAPPRPENAAVTITYNLQIFY